MRNHEMDGKRSSNTAQPETQGNESNDVTTDNSASIPTPPPDALMAHFSAAAAMEQMGPYDNFFPPGPTLIPPFYHLIQQDATPSHLTTTPPTDFPWNRSMPQQSFQQLPQAGPSQYHSMNMSPLQFQGHSDMIMTQGMTVPQSPQGTSDVMGHPQFPPEVELEAAEEKRHRNTVASARFRTKKKHKTIALERSVTDLTGKAKDLEREVADLRRENDWLKEIVMLKGAQFAANNRTHQEALQRAASLVTGGQIEFTPASVGDSKQSEEESEDSRDLDEDDKNKEKIT